jgi:hypothetical protein
LVTTLIVKTVFDVAKGMRVKNQENNTKTAFECYLDGLKQARKDAINLDPNIGDKEAAKRHVDDKMKQGRAIVATGMRFFGNRFVQNVKLPGKVVIGLSDYMRKAIIS